MTKGQQIRKSTSPGKMLWVPIWEESLQHSSLRISFHYYSLGFAAYWSVLTTVILVSSERNFKAIHLLFGVYISFGGSVPSHSVLNLQRSMPTIIISSLSYTAHCWTPQVHGHLKGHATTKRLSFVLVGWLSLLWTIISQSFTFHTVKPHPFPTPTSLMAKFLSWCPRKNSSREGLLRTPFFTSLLPVLHCVWSSSSHGNSVGWLVC